mmetsp:Transcript_18479/g.16352  ORF Transcript_18479/g.16352 Transcript_18479/m.16352 type:complete len:137 (-) Transcript_18479:13-423(-)
MILLYSDFLNRPFVGNIKARNLLNPPIDISKKTIEFVSNLKEIEESTKLQDKSERHTNKLWGNLQEAVVKAHLDKIHSLYYHHIGMMRVNPLKRNYTPKDFDCDRPHIFHKDYKLDSGFIIRSESTKDLKDNMNFK